MKKDPSVPQILIYHTHSQETYADYAAGNKKATVVELGNRLTALLEEKGYQVLLDPETAKAIRDARLPEDDHSDTCSMCGKFCAVRSMNKALAGEHIDIL